MLVFVSSVDNCWTSMIVIHGVLEAVRFILLLSLSGAPSAMESLHLLVQNAELARKHLSWNENNTSGIFP